MSKRVHHPPCGKSWKQSGNKAGHCSGCHETFYGIGAFDAHFTRTEDGRPVCRHPEGIDKPGPWWLDDDNRWHLGKRMTREQIKEVWGR